MPWIHRLVLGIEMLLLAPVLLTWVTPVVEDAG